MTLPGISFKVSCALFLVFAFAMELNSNFWYRLTSTAAAMQDLSLIGAPPTQFNGIMGDISFSTSDNNSVLQQWQVFPVGTSAWVLRTRAAGPNAFLTTRNSAASGVADPVIIPRIANRSDVDSSMYWSIEEQGSNEYFLSGREEDGQLRLDFRRGRIAMDDDTSPPQPGQAISFVSVGEINDLSYSTADLPTPLPTYVATATVTQGSEPSTVASRPTSTFITTTIPATRTPTSRPTNSSTSTSSPSTMGLSRAASMGIGAAITVFSVVAALLLGLFLYKRWKKRRTNVLPTSKTKSATDSSTISPASTWGPSQNNSSTISVQMIAGREILEMPAPTVELPAIVPVSPVFIGPLDPLSPLSPMSPLRPVSEPAMFNFSWPIIPAELPG